MVLDPKSVKLSFITQGRKKKKRKEKVTPVARYRHDYEPVNLMLIVVVRDAT